MSLYEGILTPGSGTGGFETETHRTFGALQISVRLMHVSCHDFQRFRKSACHELLIPCLIDKSINININN